MPLKIYGIDKRYKRNYTRYKDPQYVRWVSFKKYETAHMRDRRLEELRAEDSVFEYKRSKSGMIH
jgi:hypothetical protein